MNELWRESERESERERERESEKERGRVKRERKRERERAPRRKSKILDIKLIAQLQYGLFYRVHDRKLHIFWWQKGPTRLGGQVRFEVIKDTQ